MESVLYTRIKELCENRGISMTKLSEDLGIAASLIRKWKTTTSPSVDKVKMIAEYFGVSADYLIGLSDIQDSAEKLVGDEDFVSLQRAKSRMSPQDKERMMGMLRLGFHEAFKDEEHDMIPKK